MVLLIGRVSHSEALPLALNRALGHELLLVVGGQIHPVSPRRMNFGEFISIDNAKLKPNAYRVSFWVGQHRQRFWKIPSTSDGFSHSSHSLTGNDEPSEVVSQMSQQLIVVAGSILFHHHIYTSDSHRGNDRHIQSWRIARVLDRIRYFRVRPAFGIERYGLCCANSVIDNIRPWPMRGKKSVHTYLQGLACSSVGIQHRLPLLLGVSYVEGGKHDDCHCGECGYASGMAITQCAAPPSETPYCYKRPHYALSMISVIGGILCLFACGGCWEIGAQSGADERRGARYFFLGLFALAGCFFFFYQALSLAFFGVAPCALILISHKSSR
jgi:hypothetical protein